MNRCVFSRKQAGDSHGCIARKGEEDSHGDKLEDQHIGLSEGVFFFFGGGGDKGNISKILTFFSADLSL